VLFLIVTDEPENQPMAQEALAHLGWQWRHVADSQMALARIGGGGVAAAVLDWSGPGMPYGHQWEMLSTLREQAPETPLLILGERGGGGIGERAMRSGAVAYLTAGTSQEWETAFQHAMSRARGQRGASHALSETPRSNVVSVMGARGGTGTTTVAWSLAAGLGERGSVILAELRSTTGTLEFYFRPGRSVKRLTHLLSAPAEIGLRSAEACLWPSPTHPNLRVLFGPAMSLEHAGLSSPVVANMVESLAALADHVVLDLPSTLTEGTRAAIKLSRYLCLTTDREPLGSYSTKLLVELMRDSDLLPPLSGLVIVNRFPIVAPLSLEDMESATGLPILEVIPPSGDVCVRSQKSGTPLIELDAEGLAGEKLRALARRVEQTRPSLVRIA
jgi:pilus assembly protein CpaE